MRLRKDALPGLKLKAAAGSQDAQYWLGMVITDISKAATLLRAAARQGHPLAGYELGRCLGGLGDKEGAVRVWQDRSLCADTAQVKWSLGIYYRKGNGVKKDTAKAFNLLKESMEEGHLESKNEMGMMYRDGMGTPVNLPRAVQLFEAGAKGGHSLALLNLGVCKLRGLGCGVDAKEAERLFRLAATMGSVGAQSMLGTLLMNTNVDESTKFLRLAAAQGDSQAQFCLGKALIKSGWGIDVAMKAEGFELIRLSAAQGYMNAQTWLAAMYADGTYGLEKDLHVANKLAKHAQKSYKKMEETAALGESTINTMKHVEHFRASFMNVLGSPGDVHMRQLRVYNC
jgi:hypothetical protein